MAVLVKPLDIASLPSRRQLPPVPAEAAGVGASINLVIRLKMINMVGFGHGCYAVYNPHPLPSARERNADAPWFGAARVCGRGSGKQQHKLVVVARII